MGSVILPSATTALTYKRLNDVVERLDRKLRTPTYEPDAGFIAGGLDERTARNAAERRVLSLAKAARDMFRHGDTVPLPSRSALTSGFSTYSMLGASAWEWPYFAELYGTPSPWVAEAMRRGSPDLNRGHVHVDTPGFAFAAAKEAIDGASAADKDKARAYAMGLFCASAHGVITSPVLRGLGSVTSTRGWNPDRPGHAIAEAERRALAELLGGVAGGAMQNWLPPTSDVPAAIHDGYLAALTSVYGFPAARPPGFADFEDSFTDGDEITAQRLRSAQSFLYHQTLTRSWGVGTWWLALSPGLLAVPLSLLIGRALPNASAFFSAGPEPGERGAYEMLTLGMGLGSLAPLGWSMFLWSQLDGHLETFVNALVMGIARTGLTTAALATHGSDLAAAARWAGLWLPMQAIDVYGLVRGIIHQTAGRPGDAFVYWLNLLPTMSGVTSLLFAELMKLIGLDSDLGYWLTWVLLTGGLLAGVGLPLAFWLRANGGIASIFQRTASEPPLEAVDAAARRLLSGPADLFDDATLWRDGPGTEFENLRYPSHTRGLVRIHWTAESSLEVAHDEHLVRLRVDGGEPVEVALGLGDLTARGLAGRLRAALPDLQVELVDADTADLALPFPSALDDPGDEAASLAVHDQLAAEFQPVGETSEDGYVIRHAPHSESTSRFGLSGSSASGVDAVPLLPPASPHDTDESAMGLAADLAALMTMGAAPSLAAAPILPAAVAGLPPLTAPADTADEVYQVFRRWNLDQRRINEWRMLVSGGAHSEKTAAAADYDTGMRAHASPASYASAAPGGEALASALGWIPTWRAWLRMATDLTADTSSTSSEPYNPMVPAAEGDLRQTTNAELTEAVRFLLDLK